MVIDAMAQSRVPGHMLAHKALQALHSLLTPSRLVSEKNSVPTSFILSSCSLQTEKQQCVF